MLMTKHQQRTEPHRAAQSRTEPHRAAQDILTDRWWGFRTEPHRAAQSRTEPHRAAQSQNLKINKVLKDYGQEIRFGPASES